MVLTRRIEEASLNAWPALQQILFDGWILRFSKGYTKRANSVNALYTSSIAVEAKVEACERLYAERGLPPIFRLTPFTSPPDLDRVLEGRGYRQLDPTRVLHLDLSRHAPPVPAVDLRIDSLDDWLETFSRLSGATPEKHRAHGEILAAIASQCLPASLWVAGRAVACGLGVLEMDHLGLFDLVTAPHERRKGHGVRLVSSLLKYAREIGAAHAYLQVMCSNEPARRLYDKLGFRDAYGYWYRVPGARGPDRL